MKALLLPAIVAGLFAFAAPAEAGGFGVYVNLGGGYCAPYYRPVRVYYPRPYYCPPAYYVSPVVVTRSYGYYYGCAPVRAYRANRFCWR